MLSAEVFNGWKALTGLEIIEGLGSTEVLHIYLSNRPEKKKPGAAGLRVPGYGCRYGIHGERGALITNSADQSHELKKARCERFLDFLVIGLAPHSIVCQAQ